MEMATGGAGMAWWLFVGVMVVVVMPKRVDANNAVRRIKVVEQPAMGGSSSSSLSSAEGSASGWPDLTGRMPKAAFKGPAIFEPLVSKCFSYSKANYVYRACLFDNVTQHDVGSTWQGYHGVLGMYSHWTFSDEELTGLHFAMGDPCHTTDRHANVSFECGTKNRIVDVEEPVTCKYLLRFETPLACNSSLDLQEVLTPQRQARLGTLRDELRNGEISEQGFGNRLRHLLVGEGLVPAQQESTDDARQGSEENGGEGREEGGVGKQVHGAQAATQGGHAGVGAAGTTARVSREPLDDWSQHDGDSAGVEAEGIALHAMLTHPELKAAVKRAATRVLRSHMATDSATVAVEAILLHLEEEGEGKDERPEVEWGKEHRQVQNGEEKAEEEAEDGKDSVGAGADDDIVWNDNIVEKEVDESR